MKTNNLNGKSLLKPILCVCLLCIFGLLTANTMSKSPSSLIEECSLMNNYHSKNDTLIDEKVYDYVAHKPEPVEGLPTLMKYIVSNINYPQEAQANQIGGTVLIRFIVSKDGSIIEPKILRGIGGGCDEEALRVVKTITKFIPGKIDGEPVNSLFTLPIKFNASRLLDSLSQISNLSNNKNENEVLDMKLVDEKPEFPGGPNELLKYLASNARYSDEAKYNGIEGKLKMSFIISKDGSIKDVKVLKGLGGGLDEMGLKLIKEMPKWKP